MALCIFWLLFGYGPQDLGQRKFPRQFNLNQSSTVSGRAGEGHKIFLISSGHLLPPGLGLETLGDMDDPINLSESAFSSVMWT